jgi:DinB family protein
MNTPIGRSAQLRHALEEKFSGFLGTIGRLSETQWAQPCTREGWPVGYVAHHIGQGITRPYGWITQALAGDDPFNYEWDVTHELNAHRSQRLGLPAKDETIRYVRVATANFCDLIGSLSDAQLKVIAFTQKSPKHGSVRRSVEWVAELVMRHVDEHHPSILDALASV